MPAYTTISNALVAVGAKPFATTIQALRDNPLAIAEGDATAPRINSIAAMDHQGAVGAVGTYALLSSSGANVTFTAGSTYAGSNLRYGGYVSTPAVHTSGTAPAGTWRAMGQVAAVASQLSYTVFLRIS